MMALQIRKQRVSKGLTQKQISQLLNISQNYYSNIETGKRRPSPEIAKKIAHTLDIDWTHFYDGNGQEI